MSPFGPCIWAVGGAGHCKKDDIKKRPSKASLSPSMHPEKDSGGMLDELMGLMNCLHPYLVSYVQLLI